MLSPSVAPLLVLLVCPFLAAARYAPKYCTAPITPAYGYYVGKHQAIYGPGFVLKFYCLNRYYLERAAELICVPVPNSVCTEGIMPLPCIKHEPSNTKLTNMVLNIVILIYILSSLYHW